VTSLWGILRAWRAAYSRFAVKLILAAMSKNIFLLKANLSCFLIYILYIPVTEIFF